MIASVRYLRAGTNFGFKRDGMAVWSDTHRFDANTNSAIRFSSSNFTQTREERRVTNRPFFKTLNTPSTLCVAVMFSVMVVGK